MMINALDTLLSSRVYLVITLSNNKVIIMNECGSEAFKLWLVGHNGLHTLTEETERQQMDGVF